MPATPYQSSIAPAYDGVGTVVGVWGGDSQAVPPLYCHQAINRFFREDGNRTRPRIQSTIDHFESEADRIWFRGGNGQGAFFYSGYPSTLNPKIIVSIAGKIFAGTIIGRDCYWKVIWSGNATQYCLAWFAQGFEWLFIQDGINQPVLWNGTDPARRSDPTKGEMPIGSVMAYIHGRMAVASSDGTNSIRVGNIVYGDNLTNHNDLLFFTDDEYWAEGGSFDIAAPLGDIMGLYAMPWLDTGTGANELVALCTQGFTSFDLSQERANWLDTQVQQISMIGQGCVSSIGFAGLNGDLFYRRADGIGSYRNARTEFTRTWRASPISREVNRWLKYDRTDLLKFSPMVTWQNMVFCGVSPQIAAPNNPCAGFHRFCRGMVVLDAQSMSTTSRDGAPVWHGAWTGIRPWALVQGRIDTADRCFALSYDRDGSNRLYELTLNNGPDLFGNEKRKQFYRFDTGAFGQVEARCSYYDLKRMTGGQIVFSEIINEGDFEVLMRPDGAPCYVTADSGELGCDCAQIESCGISSQPQWLNKYIQALPDSGSEACVPGTTQPAAYFHYMQTRVQGHGSMKIERIKVRMDVREVGENVECSAPNCERVSCCPDADDFSYHIAPTGNNAEVPDIPCFVPPGVTYVSTRYFTAYCESMPSIFTTGKGQATSDISQLDADEKALAAAEANAIAALTCPACQTEVIFAFTIDGGTEDLSAYFAVGLFSDNINQPWRLYDIITLQLIATGHVDASGTLVTDQSDWGYAHGTWNPASNVYTDNGGGYSGGSTTINLQLGCNLNGEQTWPEAATYVGT